MKKRLILFSAIFMFAILLMVVMPNTVSAAVVNSISLTIEEPTLKGTPANTANVTSVDPIRSWTNNVGINTWYEKNATTGTDWVEMTTEKFRAGYYYLPSFDSWWYDNSIGTNTVLTVNGQNVGTYGEWTGFGPLDYIKVTELNIQITEPVLGQNPNTDFEITSELNDALREGITLNWYEGNTNNKEDFDRTNPMLETDTFKEDKYYLAAFSDKILDEDYVFDTNAVIKVNGVEKNIENGILYGPFLKDYVVSFDPNGGTGTMDSVVMKKGTLTLPENKFTAPKEKEFKGWSKSSDGEIIKDKTIDITGDTTLYAIWKEKTNNPKTGDTIITMTSILLMSFAGLVILSKKYKNV